MTDFERQTLINQFKILAIIEPEKSEKYGIAIKILQNGITPLYSEKVFNELYDEIQSEDFDFVFDILSLYSQYYMLLRANNQQHRFLGFSLNKEPDLLRITRVLLNDLHCFPELTEVLDIIDNFNSHTEMKAKYKKYLSNLAKVCPETKCPQSLEEFDKIFQEN